MTAKCDTHPRPIAFINRDNVWERESEMIITENLLLDIHISPSGISSGLWSMTRSTLLAVKSGTLRITILTRHEIWLMLLRTLVRPLPDLQRGGGPDRVSDFFTLRCVSSTVKQSFYCIDMLYFSQKLKVSRCFSLMERIHFHFKSINENWIHSWFTPKLELFCGRIETHMNLLWEVITFKVRISMSPQVSSAHH